MPFVSLCTSLSTVGVVQKSLHPEILCRGSMSIATEDAIAVDEEVIEKTLSGDEDEDSGEDDDAGSLVDFVVDDDDAAAPEEDKALNDLQDIDEKNIVQGKRKRKATQFYDREVFASKEYRKMVLDDVPDEELDAAVGGESGDDDGDDSGEEEDEDSDGEYSEDEEDAEADVSSESDEETDEDSEEDSEEDK